MASMMAMPCIGHLGQLYHILAYLRQKHSTEIFFEPTVPDINMESFLKEDWCYTPYADAKEELPPNVPDNMGLGFTMSANVDSDHA
eukprot:12786108-Ditylum_brightwellii.AAC.1